MLALGLGAMLAALPATGARLQVLVDKGTPATGCQVATPDGPFNGVDEILDTDVDMAAVPPRVGAVTRSVCAGGSFGAPQPVDAGGWPVGNGQGTAGSALVETYYAPLPESGLWRIAFVYDDPAFGTDAVTSNATGGAITVLVGADAIPASTTAGLALLAALLGAAAWWHLKRTQGAGSAVVVLLLAAGIATAWAAITLQGRASDWAGVPALATDATGDAPGGADLVAVFAKREGLRMYFRADVRNAAVPVASNDSYGTASGAPLTVPASAGVLANDARGVPPANVTGFGGGSLPGSTTTNAAGTSVAFGSGGSLRIDADGALAFTPPPGFTGAFTTGYRIGNGVGTADATLTIGVNQPPAFTSTNAATFAVGTAGTFTVAASGFPAPALALASGTLPAGVSFTAATGALAGTPAPGTVGTHVLQFSADNGIAPPATQSFTLTVGKGSASVALASSANPSTLNQPVTFTATVTPATATGTVTFRDGATTLGTATIVAGSAAFTTGALTVGPHAITADYAGDANFLATSSATLAQTVSAAASTTSLASSANPSTFGQPVTFTATVAPAGATGTVTFTDGAVVLGSAPLAAGTASLTTSVLAVGTRTITAAYGGDANFGASSGSVAQVVNKAAATVVLTGPPAPAFGQPLTLTATLSPAGASGSVTFRDGTTTLGTAAVVAGQATFTTSSLAAGPHSFTAEYGGDASYLAATSSALALTVQKAVTAATLTSSAPTTGLGLAATFTATLVPATATGTVTFRDGATTLGTATIAAGVATFSTTALAVGPHAITAEYPGDANHQGVTSASLAHTVSPAATATTLAAVPNPSVFGQSVTLTATVAPSAATGTVTFRDGAAVLGTASLAGGTATLTTSALAVGAHDLTAAYAGDGSYTGSTSVVLVQNVNAVATTVGLASSQNPATVGASITFTATVTPATATGSVAFTDGGAALGSGVIAAGVATLTTSALTAGTHPIVASYAGDASHAPATSSTLTQTMQAAPVFTAGPTSLAVTAGQPIPAGTVYAASGFPAPTFAVTAGTLPSGVTLSAAGTLAGTPAAGATFTVTASNGIAPDATRQTVLTLACPALTLSPTALPAATLGTAYSQTFSTAGGTAPYGYGATGALPGGLALAGATLTGVPNAAGSFTFTIQSTDAFACTTSRSYTVLACPTIALAPAATALPALTRDRPYTATVTATPAGSYSFAGSGLPSGLGISAAGVISGTTSQSGSYSFTVTATDGNGCAGSTTYTGTINDPPLAQNDSYDAIGNTPLEVAPVQAASAPVVFVASTVLANDSDAQPLAIVAPGTQASTQGGSCTLTSAGALSYLPPAGFSGTDTCSYTVTDGIATSTATISLNVGPRVWYVDSAASATGADGTAGKPFTTLPAVQAASFANDTIYVRTGAATTAAGLALKSGQRLIGAGVALDVPVAVNGGPNPTPLLPAGTRPTLANSGGDAVTVTDVANVVVRGVGIGATTGDGIRIATGAGFAGSGTYAILDNVIAANGHGVRATFSGTGTMQVGVADNTVQGGVAAIDLLRSAGTVYVTDFDGNVVPGTSAAGISVSGAVFDAIPGGALDPVPLGALSIGSAGDPVTGSGLVLAGVTGDLVLDTSSIHAGSGSALSLTGSGAFTGGAGTRLRSSSGATLLASATAGSAVNATSATLDLPAVTLSSSNAATSGVSLSSVGGTFAALAGSTISNATGAAFSVSGGNAAISYNGTISSTRQLVSVSGRTAGSTSFGGAISGGASSPAAAISLAGNGGSTIAFTGGVAVSSGAQEAFSATGGGTVTVTGAANTLATTTATALRVTGTIIGGAGLNFRSIAVTGNGTLPANGIVLNATGAGALAVTGTGASGTGGTIANTGGDGISLTGTGSVQLAQMAVSNTGAHGLFGSGVGALVLNGLSITGAGTTALHDGIQVTNLAGTSSFTGVTVTGAERNAVFIDNTSGALALTVTGSTFSANSATNGNNLFLLQARSTASVNPLAISGSTFANGRASGLQVIAENTASITNLSVASSTFTTNNNHIDLNQAHTATLQASITSNTGMTGSASHAINVFSDPASTGGFLRARITGNAVGNAGVAGSGSAIGNCVRVNVNGGAKGEVLVDGNTLRQCPNGRGIEVIGRNGTGTLDVTVTNNSVDPQAPANPLAGILVQSNCLATCNSVRADVRGNTVPAGASTDLLPTFLALVRSSTSTLQLVGSGADCTSRLGATNTGSASASAACTLIPGPIATPP